MAQVYVSYGEKDRGSALPVIEAMHQAGLDVWHYDMISAGSSFLEQMRRELDKAQCVVVLWSEAAAQSEFLQQEIHHAIQAWSSDRLVLAALDDTPLPVGLRDLSPISIQEASDSSTKQLIERAQAIVGRSSEVRRLEAAQEVFHKALEEERQALEEERKADEEVRRAAEAAHQSRDDAARSTAPRDVGPIVAAVVLLAGIAVLAAAILFFNVSTQLDKAAKVASERPAWERAASERAARERAAREKGARELDSKADRGFGDGGGSGGAFLDNRPTADLPFVLTVLALGLASGAGATACIVWLRRRSNRAPTTMLVQLPAVSDGVRVFVSYSRQDGRTVEQLVRQIEGLGHGVWIDRQSISAQRYAASIVAAIRDSRVIALMCSRNAFASDHVIREVYVAGDYKKPFIVFQLDSTGLPDEILYFVSGYPRLPIATVDQQQLRSEIARLLAA
jgi:hypothetical protein